MKTEIGKPSSEQLKEAFYAFEDVMERLHHCPYFPLKSTARDMSLSPDNELTDDKLYFGVRKREWTDNRQSLFEIVSKHLKFDFTQKDNKFNIELNGVPIELTLITKSYKVFEKPNISFWGVTEVLMPNPIDRYLKIQHIVR